VIATYVQRIARAVQTQEVALRTPTHSRRSASFLRPRARSAVSNWSRAPGRAGTPLALHHAPGHQRWLVAGRARRRACCFIRCFLDPKGVAPAAAFNSVHRFCTLATALAVASGHRCATRILARATSWSIAPDEARQRPSETHNRRFPHGAAGGRGAAKPGPRRPSPPRT